MFILKNNPSLRRIRLMRRNFLTPCTNTYNLSLRIARQMRRGFGTWCTNSYTSDKTPSRCPLDASTGRSMVEMLGVLAIIGVLSVGAISGYSKAMMKYKLNKQAESFNMLLNTAIQLQPDLLRTVNQGTRISDEFFYKANLLPDGMTFKNNRIYDIFNSELHFLFYHSPQNGQTSEYTEYLLEYKMERSGSSATAQSISVCRNMLTVAKKNAGDLPFIQLRSGKDDGNYDVTRINGDNACANGRNCLRNMGIKEMDDFCSSCNSENFCTILYYIYFYNPY